MRLSLVSFLRNVLYAMPSDVIEVLGLSLHRHDQRAKLNGLPLALTPMEYRLIEALALQPGRIFTRAELANHCCPNTTINERTIDTYIKTLRRKLSGFGGKIETIRGIGYRM